MMDLEELRSALNWSGVFQGKDCLVITFEEGQAGLIQGLSRNDQCFFLNFPEYQNHPVSFLVSRGPETFQYWVLGDKLHRVDHPAKISSYDDGTTKRSLVEYFENGLVHRTGGPAQVNVKGQTLGTIHPLTQTDLGKDYVIEEWDEMEAYWFERGIPPLYPQPFSVLCTNGYRIYRTTGSEPILDDFREHPAFSAGTMVSNWTREKDSTQDDDIRMRFLLVEGYHRHYHMGEPGTQGCEEIKRMSWIIQGEITDIDPKVADGMRKNLFPEWNIWEGPLFPDEQEEIFAITEVSK